MNKKRVETRWKRHHDKQELKKQVEKEIEEGSERLPNGSGRVEKKTS